MDFNDLVLIGLVCGFISLLFTIVLGFVLHALRNRDIDNLNRDLDDLYARLDHTINSFNGTTGRKNRKELEERAEEAMTQVALLIKDGKQPMDAVKEVAMKYPDVAMKIMKKGISL